MRGIVRAFGLVGVSSVALAATPTSHPVAAVTASSVAAATGGRLIGDSLLGRSGRLRFRFLTPARPLEISTLERLFGDSVSHSPGVYAVRDSAMARPFSFITRVPFSMKAGGHLGGYRVGFWPGERKGVRSGAYGNPDGFITVTAANQDTYVSDHFRLRDFLTHDQQDVWPKYLVLREELIDKLELLIDELERSGVAVSHLSVMSGFRTPQYNAKGVRKGGRAQDSRHQFGDAADVFVDNNGDGRMDDLNHDGRVDTRDVRVIIAAVERVEARHPDLVGGAGLYRATRSHGPFAHVDVRGTRARWGRG
jgi:hypothetical protein